MRFSKTGDTVGRESRMQQLLSQLLADAARDWGLPKGIVVAICVLPLFVVLTGIGTGLVSKELYKWFIDEDRVAENVQVLAYVLSCFMSLWIAIQLRKVNRNGFALLYLCAAAGLFLTAGEEISWGQRLFSWQTPQLMAEINRQQETTLHNIVGVEQVFNLGKLAVGLYGTIVPLLVLYWWDKLAPYRRTLSLLVPHYALALYFFVPAIWRLYRDFAPEPTQYQWAIAEFSEVTELDLALGILFFLIFQLKHVQSNIRDQA